MLKALATAREKNALLGSKLYNGVRREKRIRESLQDAHQKNQQLKAHISHLEHTHSIEAAA